MDLHPLVGQDRTLVIGILNVTPDSFSDGGQFLKTEAAVSHGKKMSQQGADIVDVGGESTRPGASRVHADAEAARVVPVITGLAAAGLTVSVDTMRSTVASAAVAAGARLVNDVSGGLADPAMLDQVAALQVPIVLMHWRAHSLAMDELVHYDDVVAEVCLHLAERRDAAIAAGIPADRIVLDPGLGFAKLADHNWELLSDFQALLALGQPILVGASRKRFLGALLSDDDGVVRPVSDREAATQAISALAAAAGAWGVRVHNVAGTADAVRVGRAWSEGGDR